ncbi:Aspercryptin biosynthesis cluster-specific transcription regulator atnN [Colletotrichum trifolii]|uniref:Aspercryptin biosynthesis cluster-specific transcription regulator atnN n=1 Tax=Colletotrichum trifolii TaxID=5466 RepID=A0A4R8RQ43_COLTR|nr:Aspercryptin biosynthesis cluster-specific transcription regulator atnN [Colletotrichum trifolii]
MPLNVPPTINRIISGTAAERAMFHHVCQCTITEFGNVALLSRLWSHYIVPLGYYSDSVKHALIALGSSHRAFVGDQHQHQHHHHGMVDTKSYEHLAVQQYTKAVRAAATDMQNLTPVTVRTSLVCCIIFICFEIMQGRYDKALQHLRSGSKILESISKAHPSSASPAQKCLAETGTKYYFQLCDIADMFACLASDAAFLMEEGDVIPDLSFYWRVIGSKDVSEPFSGVDEARYELYRVEQALGKALSFSFRGKAPISWTAFLNLPEESLPQGDEWFEEWTVARHLFDVWSARLDSYGKALATRDDVSGKELWEAQMMEFIRKDWAMLIKISEASQSSRPVHRKHFLELIDEAEVLVQSDSGGKEQQPPPPPVFTLAADVIPRMVFIAAFSEDRDLQERAIGLLYAMRRREGMWDSRELASLLQSILAARECDGWDREFEKVSLPRLAGMLQSLNLYQGGGTLPLATLVDGEASTQ